MQQLLLYVQLLRLRQWIKNVLVFGPLVFAQDFTAVALHGAGLAFVAFSLAASTVYALNDLIDAPRDRLHPEKKHRPVASRRISRPAAMAAMLACLSAAGIIGLLISPRFALVLLAYLLLNLAYSTNLKRRVIVDVMCVAFGFVLRVLAGGVAVGVSVSHWILLCTFFGSLLLALGKRRSETSLLKEDSHNHRFVLQHYTPDFLNQLLGVSSALTIMSYVAYVTDSQTIARFQTDRLVYTVPLVVYGIFRYYHLTYNRAMGGDPTRIFLRDRYTGLTALLWLVLFLAIIRIH